MRPVTLPRAAYTFHRHLTSPRSNPSALPQLEHNHLTLHSHSTEYLPLSGNPVQIRRRRQKCKGSAGLRVAGGLHKLALRSYTRLNTAHNRHSLPRLGSTVKYSPTTSPSKVTKKLSKKQVSQSVSDHICISPLIKEKKKNRVRERLADVLFFTPKLLTLQSCT